MIKSIEDCLKEISNYDDTPDIARYIDVHMLPTNHGSDRVTLNEAVENLRGMHSLLRSMRHHLAVKALDNS